MENENKSLLSKDHTPIIIGNCKPFRLITRELDTWNPTLKELNSRDYDYVKLNRMSTFIDIGIRPLSLGLGFDGSLVLPAIKEYKNKDTATLKFNETLGILLLGGVYSQAVQPEDISYGWLHFDGYIKNHGGATGLVSNFHRSIRTKHVGTIDAINLLNPPTLSVKMIEDAYRGGKEIISKLKNLSPSLLLNGTSNFVRQQWSESLIFLWTTIEQIIDLLWEGEVIKTQTAGTIEGRKDFLRDYRTWTTSARIELLFQKGIIPLEVYQVLNVARKVRNDFIHNGKPLTEEKTRNALEGMFKLVSLVVTDYKYVNDLDHILDLIYRNERGDFYAKKTVYEMREVSHWLEIPPLPGDSHWGNKKYDVIEELVLKPLEDDSKL